MSAWSTNGTDALQLAAAGAEALPRFVRVGRESCADFDQATQREWLVTNGIGGYASGTVSGARTRRYHGLLVAALQPPLGRTLLVAKTEITSRYLGRCYRLSSNEYRDGTIDPRGYRFIESFELEGMTPVWRWSFADALLEQRIWMAQGRNTTYLSFRLVRASAPVELELAPLVCYRDDHGQTRGGWDLGVVPVPRGLEVRAFDGACAFRLLSEEARAETSGSGWYWHYHQRLERWRGLDDEEDLFRAGTFRAQVDPGQITSLCVSAERDDPIAPAEALHLERQRQEALLARLASPQPEWIRQLVLAADQFIVRRGEEPGRTIIAGYPWFGDWGRDTMIALPGLTIATAREGDAAAIIRTFAAHTSEGMLPNRFPEQGEAPEYNTVDATLWYFEAAARLGRRTGDERLIGELYPVLRDIIDWHERGTRYAIKVDPSDGLLFAGEAGVQLTWMDAKVDGWVVTPRIGKAVEVNALWHNALDVMRDFAATLGYVGESRRYDELASAVAERFRERFWCERAGYLYDVIDGPEGELDAKGRRGDATLRPNQIVAVALPAPLLTEAQERAVLTICGRELFTTRGLRTLDPDDPRYIGRYGGGRVERDGAYHQGTAWPWLIGLFASAHYRVYRDAGVARTYLADLAHELFDGCLGTLGEIVDGDPPHRPRGCIAQAWSVAEVLRAWSDIGAAEGEGSKRTRGMTR